MSDYSHLLRAHEALQAEHAKAQARIAELEAKLPKPAAAPATAQAPKP